MPDKNKRKGRKHACDSTAVCKMFVSLKHLKKFFYLEQTILKNNCIDINIVYALLSNLFEHKTQIKKPASDTVHNLTSRSRHS